MPAAKAATNVSTQIAALAAFPSPASIRDSQTPILETGHDESRLRSPQSSLTLHDSLGTADILPGDVVPESVVTPPADDMPGHDMNIIAGGALAPVHANLPSRPQPKRSRPGFRLPSFQSLGIANPNPDRFGLDGNLTQVTAETMRPPSSTHYGCSGFAPVFPDLKLEQIFQDAPADAEGKVAGGRAIQSPVHQLVHTLTPPAEAECIDWTSLPTVITAMDSPPTGPDNVGPTETPRQTATVGDSAEMASQIPTQQETDQRPSWIRSAIDVLVNNHRIRPTRPDALRIISHALPSPSTTGHIFSEVIGAVSSSTPGSASSSTTWINVFHAIPGRFNIQDLPRSPPSTPGPAVGGDDYFTAKVFDSAVSIADYQQDLTQLPRSPVPVVPPNSVDVSIVERYIPPSSSNEFTTMFNTNGHSLLIDRLIELSPSNGSLLFIYPTRTGAETFMREYLGPILDPLLRTFAVTQNFSEELNRTLSSMASVDHMPEFETLRRRIELLCDRLTNKPSTAERFHGRRPNLTLSYASKQYVMLNREAWSKDWFNKQEKMRIREMLTKHSRDVQKLPRKDTDNERLSASELLERLLHGVEKNAYAAGGEPTHGVEVGVFVITRSS